MSCFQVSEEQRSSIWPSMSASTCTANLVGSELSSVPVATFLDRASIIIVITMMTLFVMLSIVHVLTGRPAAGLLVRPHNASRIKSLFVTFWAREHVTRLNFREHLEDLELVAKLFPLLRSYQLSSPH